MDEYTVLADVVILAAILFFSWQNGRSKHEIHDRVDDVVHGLATLARELLDRTDRISELAGKCLRFLW